MKKLSLALLLAGSLSLIGCGSGGGSSSDTSSSDTTSVETAPTTVPTSNTNINANYVGYLLDAPVEGIDYKCIDRNGNVISEGVTRSNGEFNYNEKIFTCEFGIKNGNDFLSFYQLNLTGLSAVYGFNVVPNNMLVFPTTNASMIFQTMDIDGNLDNGIQITQEEKDVIADNFNSMDIVQIVTPDPIYSVLVANVSDYNGKPIDLSTATANVFDTIYKVVKEGVYEGTFQLLDGDPEYCLKSGSVSLNISVNPTIYHVSVTGKAGNVDEMYNLNGQFAGIFAGVTDDGDNTMWYGYYTSDNKIEGYYESALCKGKWEVTYQ